MLNSIWKACCIVLMFLVFSSQLLAEETPPGYYERFPHMQEWFPFGMYQGDNVRDFLAPGLDKKSWVHLFTEKQALIGCNVIWGQWDTLSNTRTTEAGELELTPFGEWYYGECLSEYEMRIWPNLIAWTRYDRDVWKDVYDRKELLTPEEIKAKTGALAPVIRFANHMRDRFPETVVGFITDDEPSSLPAAVAAQQIIQDSTGLPAMTCKPSWGGYQTFGKHMNPLTGDWYFKPPWTMIPRMDWLVKNMPEQNFYFMALLSGSGSTPALPDQKNFRLEPEDMRLQCWIALAGGCKGFFFYRPFSRPVWSRGEDTGLNPVLEPNTGLWAEVGRLAKVMTTVGPCLLRSRPVSDDGLKIDCPPVKFMEYEGPAVGAGLLADTTAERWFVIPWNNDVRKHSDATITIPDMLMEGKAIYDLGTLTQVGEGNSLTVSLEPGGGGIYLVGTEEDFRVCRETVLRHRVSLPRVKAFIARKRLGNYFGAKTEKVDDILNRAQKAEDEQAWEESTSLYTEALAQVAAAEKEIQYLNATRSVLAEIAEVITEADDWVRCYVSVMDLNIQSRNLPADQYRNPFCGSQIKRLSVLMGQYLQALNNERLGLLGNKFLGTHLLLDQVEFILEDAKENLAGIKKAVAEALEAKRIAPRVAFLTPGRYLAEYRMAFAWLFKNAFAEWFVPDEDGVLRDRNGKAWNKEDWDVVWIHQLQYPDNFDDQGDTLADRVDPGLMKNLPVLRSFVAEGGGLLLTGVAGLMAMPLELETVSPNRVGENSLPKQTLAPGPGMDKHPILASLQGKPVNTWHAIAGQQRKDPDFLFRYPEYPELAWEEHDPSGDIVAVEHTDTIESYASIVEYGQEKGKVVVMGGRSVSFDTPRWGEFIVLPPIISDVLLSALKYAGMEERFRP